jgi:fucose 4-O-acetylase-like acetyltransferase
MIPMEALCVTESRARSDFIDVLKGVLICLVCTGHSIQYVFCRNETYWGSALFQAIYMFHMPLFMAVAGYLAQSGIRHQTGSVTYFFKRLPQYLVPMLVWSSIVQLAHVVARGAIPDDLLTAFVVKVLGSLWFLSATLMSILMVSLAVRMAKFEGPVAIAMAVGFLLLPEDPTLNLFKYTFPFFLLGYAVRGRPEFLESGNMTGAFILALLVYAWCFLLWRPDTYVYVSGMELNEDNCGRMTLRWLAGASGSVVMLFSYGWIYAAIPANCIQILKRLGSRTLEIYILQTYFFMALDKVAGKYFASASLSYEWQSYSLLFGVAVAVFCHATAVVFSANKKMRFFMFGR